MLEIIVTSWITKAVLLACAAFACWKFYDFVEFEIHIEKK